MLFDYRTRRIVGLTSLIAAVLGLSAVATLAATHPVAAQAALKSIASSVTCATSTARVIGDNTHSGPGVSGQGILSYGVVGSSVRRFVGSSAGASGVKGTGNVNYGVEGVSNRNYGVWGNSATGAAGVAGTSATGSGVYGYTTADPGDNGVNASGVVGSSAQGIGVYGDSTGAAGTCDCMGVYGSSNFVGVEATTAGSDAFFGYASGLGGGGYFQSLEGPGVIGESFNESDGYSSEGVGGAYPLMLTDEAFNNLFYVNGAGDVYYSGGLYNFSNIHGFGTVEDTGTAQLVGGSAAVRLDTAFAASTDKSTAYRVFITPDGDTRGLYVAAKTPNGFLVRETQGGHGMLAFDYRIVATKVGSANEHMSLTTKADAPHAERPVAPHVDAGTHPAITPKP